jgi:hypothetical protein
MVKKLKRVILGTSDKFLKIRDTLLDEKFPNALYFIE